MICPPYFGSKIWREGYSNPNLAPQSNRYFVLKNSFYSYLNYSIMKKNYSFLFKFCLICGLLVPTQFCFADDTQSIPISKDGNPPPTTTQPNRVTNMMPVSATINDAELAIYFETSIGEATITVTDDSNNVVYLEMVDTDSESDFYIPVTGWTSGNYNLIITYTDTTLRGEFSVE